MIAALNQTSTAALRRATGPIASAGESAPSEPTDQVSLSPNSQSQRSSGFKATALALGLAASLALSGCATTFSDGFSTTTFGVTPGGGSYIYTTPNYNYNYNNYYTPRCGYSYGYYGCY